MGFREIPLNHGLFAKVSEERFEYLSQFKWFACWEKCTKSYYARGYMHTESGDRIQVRMHRIVLGLTYKDGKICDHINGDTLDNRDENLRIVAKWQNAFNLKMNSRNKTGFRGVFLHKPFRWRAQIKHRGKAICLGLRDSPEEAYKLYLEAEEKLRGEYRRVDK